MPRDLDAPRPLNIAVVGTGIAGMSAAWLASSRHRVTVYEQDRRIGGHTNTVVVPGPDGPVPVDTGFIVYNEANYPNLVALFRHLGVPTKVSDMSFAVSVADGALEYSGTGVGGLFAQRRNLVRRRFWSMLGGLRRFYRDGPAVLDRADADSLTLGQFLDAEGYSRAFINDHLLPMAAAVWSTPSADMRQYPAAAFVRFNLNHGLMRVRGRPVWRTVEGGSVAYVNKLTDAYADRVRLGAGVRRIQRDAKGVTIEDETGRVDQYDRVIIAAHADQALAILGDPTREEREVLGAFRYAANDAVLHSDPLLMPRRRAVWSSWNHLGDGHGDGTGRVSVTYWMNRLQGLDDRFPLFVTLNPLREPQPGLVHASFRYEHPMFDQPALAAQRTLWRLQGQGNTWYCGSYFGAGFHEDALQAGLAAAEAAAGVRRPWTVDNPNGRLPVPLSAEAA